MQIPDCYDPVYQEERRQLSYTVRKMRMPKCQGCGGHIWTERYLDLEPFGLKGFACETCIERNLGYCDELEDME